jgi:non-ribosomal peptide synthetase component F
MPGLEISSVRIKLPSKFDMAVFVRETFAGFSGSWQFNTDLFDNSTIERMAKLYQAALETVAADPDTKLSAINALLAEREREGRAARYQEFEMLSRGKLRQRKRVAVPAERSTLEPKV